MVCCSYKWAPLHLLPLLLQLLLLLLPLMALLVPVLLLPVLLVTLPMAQPHPPTATMATLHHRYHYHKTTATYNHNHSCTAHTQNPLPPLQHPPQQ